MALQGQDIGLLRLNPVTGGRGKADVYGGYEAGGYHPAFAPASLWKAGASAQGTRHGERTSFTGSFSFEQVEGKEQFTSMFLEPGYFPVDVLEFTLGDKTRQTYKLGGGLATTFAEEFVLGVKANYTAANYAKRKDIRHTTYGMDLQVEPTVAVVGDNGVGLSAAYIFRKRTETIDAEQVGAATDQSYFAFLDKGMRYGTYQVWDGDGIHLDEAGVGVFPVKEFTHGFSYLVEAPMFAGGMSLLWKHGAVGEKGYDWFRYPGFSWKVFLEGRLKGGHSLRLDLNLQDDQLEESVLDKVTAGGITTPTVYAWNAVSDRNWGSLDLTYAVRFQNGPLKLLRAVLHGGLWEEKSYLMYPYEDQTTRYNGMATLVAAFGFGPVDLNLRVTRRRLRFRSRGPEPAGERRRWRLERSGFERRHGRGRIRPVPADPRLAAEDGVFLHGEGRRGVDIDLSLAVRQGPFPPGGGNVAARLRHRPPSGGRALEFDRPHRL